MYIKINWIFDKKFILKYIIPKSSLKSDYRNSKTAAINVRTACRGKNEGIKEVMQNRNSKETSRITWHEDLSMDYVSES